MRFEVEAILVMQNVKIGVRIPSHANLDPLKKK